MVAINLQCPQRCINKWVLSNCGVFAALYWQMVAINLQCPQHRIGKLFPSIWSLLSTTMCWQMVTVNLPFVHYLVLANGWYQSAVFRSNVLANGCRRLVFYLLTCVGKGCYQFTILRRQMVAGNVRFIHCILLAYGCYQRTVFHSNVSASGSYQFAVYSLPCTWNGCYEFAVIRSNVLANGCVLSICSCLESCLSKWVLSICGLFATSYQQMVAVNLKLSTAML